MTRPILLALATLATINLARPAHAATAHPYETAGAWMGELLLPGEPTLWTLRRSEASCRDLMQRITDALGTEALWRCRIVERG